MQKKFSITLKSTTFRNPSRKVCGKTVIFDLKKATVFFYI